MTAKVGIFRTGEELTAAVDELQAAARAQPAHRIAVQRRGANPELVSAYRVQKMLKLALCIAYGALSAPRAEAPISATTFRVATTPNG